MYVQFNQEYCVAIVHTLGDKSEGVRAVQKEREKKLIRVICHLSCETLSQSYTVHDIV